MIREEVENISRLAAGAQEDGTYRMLGMFNLVVDDDDTSLSPHLKRDGFWESWISTWMMNTVKPDWYCVDIGANQGYYTLLLSKLGIACYAYEPNPMYVTSIKKSLELNGYVEEDNLFVNFDDMAGAKVFPVALGASNGIAKLSIYKDLRGSSTLIEADGSYPVEQTLDVVVTALDLEIVAGHIKKPHFIKIDAEGYEDQIWAGMRTIWATHRPLVLMEFDPARNYAPGFIEELQHLNPVIVQNDGSESGVVNLSTVGQLVNIVLR